MFRFFILARAGQYILYDARQGLEFLADLAFSILIAATIGPVLNAHR
jgi:hypothetical protein